MNDQMISMIYIHQFFSYPFQGAIRGYVPDRQYISTVSIPDQQPTVGYTKDLSLPIDFLPGEEEIKLREGKIINISIRNVFVILLDIIYRSYNRKIIYRGELILTKYRLLFVTKPPDPLQV
jgi:hypothetical protein